MNVIFFLAGWAIGSAVYAVIKQDMETFIEATSFGWIAVITYDFVRES